MKKKCSICDEEVEELSETNLCRDCWEDEYRKFHGYDE
jgi:hypothetical protein